MDVLEKEWHQLQPSISSGSGEEDFQLTWADWAQSGTSGRHRKLDIGANERYFDLEYTLQSTSLEVENFLSYCKKKIPRNQLWKALIPRKNFLEQKNSGNELPSYRTIIPESFSFELQKSGSDNNNNNNNKNNIYKNKSIHPLGGVNANNIMKNDKNLQRQCKYGNL